MKRENLLKLRIVLWLSLVLTAAFFVYKNIAPSGKITYENNFINPSYFIGSLTPAERIYSPEKGYRKIVSDPAYFSLFTPRRFEKAKLTLTYKNDSGLPIIEAGVLKDKNVWRYDLQPIENNIIDELENKWKTIREGNTVLFERNDVYSSIGDFLNNQPPANEIALYNYDLNSGYRLDGYVPSNKEITFDYLLRGNYQFYTYIKNETLNFTFDFTDINLNKDPDTIDINVYSNNGIVKTIRFYDINRETDSGKTRNIGEQALSIDGLPEGVYKIEIKANDDIVTKKIKTRQSKMSFIDKIWLMDQLDKKINLLSDSNAMSAITSNPANLQVIKIGDKNLDVNETFKQFNVGGLSSGVKEIKMGKGDTIISGDGVISFNRSFIINPAFKKVDANLNLSGVNYILAKYNSPKEVNGYRIATAEFDITNVYNEKKKNTFIISIRGLKSDELKVPDASMPGLEIKDIKIELTGKSLWQKIKEIIFK